MATGQMGAVQSLDISITPPDPQTALPREGDHVVGPPAGFPVQTNPRQSYTGESGFAMGPPLPNAAQGGLASAKFTVGGIFHAGDHLHATINGHDVDYTVISGDTNLAGAAASLAAAIAADTTDNVIVTANANVAYKGNAPVASSVVVAAIGAGPSGMYPVSASVTGGGHTMTLTVDQDEMFMGPPTTT